MLRRANPSDMRALKLNSYIFLKLEIIHDVLMLNSDAQTMIGMYRLVRWIVDKIPNKCDSTDLGLHPHRHCAVIDRHYSDQIHDTLSVSSAL